MVHGTCRPLEKAKLQQLVSDAQGQKLSQKTRRDYGIVVNVFLVSQTGHMAGARVHALLLQNGNAG